MVDYFLFHVVLVECVVNGKCGGFFFLEFETFQRIVLRGLF